MPTAVAAAWLAIGSASAQRCSEPAREAVAPTLQITPVTLRILQAVLTPVAATDGLIHLAYAAQMTNASDQTATLRNVVPNDAMHGFKPTGTNQVLDADGKDITGTVLPFARGSGGGAVTAFSSRLPPGTSGIAFFDVRFRSIEDAPRLLSHHLVVSLARGGASLIADTSPVEVSCEPPVVISPPLVGPNWWNGDGCCEVVGPHRRATLPVNGLFKAPEQFAIDFAQLTDGDVCCTGPVKDLGSWPFFGTPVLAVADGTVVARVDDMPEQVPGEPKGITAQNAAGNHIIEDIGGGRYVMYAHLRTHSLPSTAALGARLTRGQKIGEVGNTGSSTSPHLHFQVMDRPSTLDAIGLPFVFDHQVLQARVTGTFRQSDILYEAGRKVSVEHLTPSPQSNRMPAEGQVFSFNQP